MFPVCLKEVKIFVMVSWEGQYIQWQCCSIKQHTAVIMCFPHLSLFRKNNSNVWEQSQIQRHINLNKETLLNETVAMLSTNTEIIYLDTDANIRVN